MGLDMYLYKMPRVAGITPKQMRVIADMHEDRVLIENGNKPWYDNLTVPEVEKEIIDDLIAKATVSYREWDTDKRWPRSSIGQEVGYWRKANAIHQWFVDHVQSGKDDCDIHDEVTKELLEELRDACRQVIESTVMVNAKIKNGLHYDFDSQSWQATMEDGKAVLNPDVCDAVLPTHDGFFFGGTDYDEYYMTDITETYELCEKLLKETDFENEMLAYRSSW